MKIQSNSQPKGIRKKNTKHTEIRHEEAGIVEGANQQDQLEKLKDNSYAEKAPNKLGTSPSDKINKGE